MAGIGSLTEHDVRRIVGLIEALDRSSFDALELELDGLKLTLGRVDSAATARPQGMPVPAETLPPSTLAAAAPSATAGQSPLARPASAPAAPSAALVPANSVAVVAPLAGIFYGRPDPASPPFVTVGARVAFVTTIGLVEVMKVFNAVAAGQDGEIVEICVGEGEAVAAGQVLMRIAPSAGNDA
jgi:acetyl-CoA carboxylase biotin carboxyl carrier protein